jgi:ADP-heptose:LPS heptosyltransferase
MILISPYSKRLRNGNLNPKNYPYWPELISMIREKFPEQTLVQIGVEGEEKLDCHSFTKHLSLEGLADWLGRCDTWIGVDNFFPHYASYIGKRGIVIFGMSDPRVFGCPENINVLRDTKYLRKHMFDFWENEKEEPRAFAKPDKIMKILVGILKKEKSNGTSL